MLWWLYVVLGLAYWLLNLVAVIRAVRTVPRLASVTPRDHGKWPRVSHVVPACNEADQLGLALRSRLDEGYPDAEFLLINDRSTDNTGALADQLAATDARLRVLHIADLPAGWLGKVHALHRGMQIATGEWLVFSDADVHLRPGTLTRAITHCEQHGLDHLGVLPDIDRGTRLLDIVMAMFLRMFCILVRPHTLADGVARRDAVAGNAVPPGDVAAGRPTAVSIRKGTRGCRLGG